MVKPVEKVEVKEAAQPTSTQASKPVESVSAATSAASAPAPATVEKKKEIADSMDLVIDEEEGMRSGNEALRGKPWKLILIFRQAPPTFTKFRSELE